MSALRETRWTAEEYLAFERASEEKHEFVDGEVYLMTGASRSHNLISLNAAASLHGQLRRRPCEIYAGDMRVRIHKRDYVYPDIVVVCGEPEFADEHGDTLLNPTMIIEVLSPSPEQYDRGRKLHSYRTLPSLQAYILVAQDTPRAEYYQRLENDEWLLRDVVGLEGVLELAPIGCALALADVYEKVSFEADNANGENTNPAS